MIGILNFLGGATMLSGVIVAIATYSIASKNPFLTPSVLDFILWVIAGAVGSVTWFALAEILRQQESNEYAIRTVYTAVNGIRDSLNAAQPATPKIPAVTSGTPRRPNKWEAKTKLETEQQGREDISD